MRFRFLGKRIRYSEKVARSERAPAIGIESLWKRKCFQKREGMEVSMPRVESVGKGLRDPFFDSAPAKRIGGVFFCTHKKTFWSPKTFILS